MVLIADNSGGGGVSFPEKFNIVGITEAEQVADLSHHQHVSSVDSHCSSNSFAVKHDDDDDDEDEYYDDDDDDDVYQEFEEYEDFSELPDSKSIASDDSFYPVVLRRSPSPQTPEPLSFFQACCSNNTIIVKMMIRQGVSEAEVKETDKNNRTGLIVACYQGYVDVVIALAQCPYVDVNWQDNEGNTALITAVQAGHIMISNYLLNYFPGLDIERRNCHGFTALMKASMQGRAACVRALMLAGGDLEARDWGRRMTPQQWALFTGRYETAGLMARLVARPCAEQFCDSYALEWPPLAGLVSQARRPKGFLGKLFESLCCCPFRLRFRMRLAPLEGGVLHHTVCVTTALASPIMATACHTVCPGSPPCVGKRRPAVQEILRRQRLNELRRLGPERLALHRRLFQNSRVQLVPRARERRASLQPQLLHNVAAAASSTLLRRCSLLPLHLVRRSSVRPGMAVPRVRVSKAPSPAHEPESGRVRDKHLLQLPKWRYKELKEERRRADQGNRRRPDPLARQPNPVRTLQ